MWYDTSISKMEVFIIRKLELSMNQQKEYEVIKSLANHPHPNKQRAAITLDCTVRHINRMLKGFKDLDIDYVPPKPKKTYIPPTNHPWHKQHLGKFVKQQEHHWNDSDSKTA